MLESAVTGIRTKYPGKSTLSKAELPEKLHQKLCDFGMFEVVYLAQGKKSDNKFNGCP